MKKFAFSLQKVLEYRKSIEDRLLGELAAIRAECVREQSKLSRLMDAKSEQMRCLKLLLGSGNVEHIKHAHSYIQMLSADILRQRAVIVELEAKRDQKTAEVVRASMDRKAMEKLREIKFTEYRGLMEYEDQKFLDDIATIRHSRISQVP